MSTGESLPASADPVRLTLLQDWLDLWRINGAPGAAVRYEEAPMDGNGSVAGPSATTTDQASLLQGRVVSATPDSISADGNVVFHVVLDLTFGPGFKGNWSDGPNERFITFVKRVGDVPYSLRLATSP
jgi:hypothetical protein